MPHRKDVRTKDIDVSPFKVKNRLNPDFFDKDGMLRSRIRLALLDIADDFVRSLEVGWVKPLDIVLTGSISNYNWTEFSDVDIHIIYDFSKIYSKKEFVKDYFDAKKKCWNDSHDGLTIKGFPVEISVEDVSEPAKSSGVYSLEKNKWTEEPEEMDDSGLDVDKIKSFCAKKMTEMNRIFARMDVEKDRKKLENLSKKLESLYDELKDMRKKGLASKRMEMSDGNIIWKVIKHAGYIDKCWDYYDKVYDRVNTIDEAVSRPNVDTRPTAYLMIGIPGAGKSTWVRNNLPDLPVVSRDIIRGYEEVGVSKGVDDKKVGNSYQETLVTDIEKKEIKELCEKGEDFVVDDTNTGKYRKGMVDYIRSCGARVVGVYVDTDEDTCKSRRDGVVPGDAIDRMFGRMIKPNADEFDDFKVVSGKDSKTVVISESQMRDIRSRLDEIKVRDKWQVETRNGRTSLDYGAYAMICSLDPTVRGSGDAAVAGKYCNWLLQRFDQSRLGDGEYKNRLRIALEQYNDGVKRGILARDGVNTDINTFKSTDEFISAMRGIMQASGTQLSQSMTNNMDKFKGQYEIVAESPNWMVVAPKTWEAERYFGSGTEWCTVGNEEYFDGYMEEGQLYITVPKTMDKKLKMQFHFEKKEFADCEDHVTRNPKRCIYNIVGEDDDFDEIYSMWSKVSPDFTEYKFTKFKDVDKLLAQGGKFESVFDSYQPAGEGFVMVKLNNKQNYVSPERKVVSPGLWFDDCDKFYNGIARVGIGFVRNNYIRTDGTFVWDKPIDEWFSCTHYFKNGFARVDVGDKSNFIRKDGTLVWDKPVGEWFERDKGTDFEDGIAIVVLNRKINYLRANGTLVWNKPHEQWFNGCDTFEGGFAMVQFGKKFNFINKDGILLYNKPTEEWFDGCDSFSEYEGAARVVAGLKFNYINRDGVFVWNKPYEAWFDNCDKFHFDHARVKIGSKYNYLRIDGTIVWDKPVSEWFDWCDNLFEEYFTKVKIGKKYNLLGKNGMLLWNKPYNQWFDKCGEFNGWSFAKVTIGEKNYKIDKNGVLHDPNDALNESIDEAAWPDFNPHEIEKIPYFAQRVRWCEKNLGPCFGQGSARMIFEIDDGKILKLAKNQKGIAQNEAEVDMSRYSDCVVQCFDCADDYSWVIEEQCVPARKSDFKRVMGITFDEFCNMVKWHYKRYAHPNRSMYVHADTEKAEDMLDRFYDQDEYGFVPELIRLMRDYQLPYGDLCRISSYGMVKRDGEVMIVLIDSGLTNDVYETYYMHKR